jgi:N-acetylglutamate synthase-like GNAT family acetyltransferase
MIELRRAESDADLESWRRVRAAVLPNERAASVEEMRRMETPDRVWLLAELEGEVVGSGAAAKSDFPDSGFVAPRVLPAARRRGVGTALLRALVVHVEALGFSRAGASVDDAGSLAFAERFGFREVDREVEQVRVVLDEEPPGRPPAGIEIVSVAEQRTLWRDAYETLGRQALEDMAFERSPHVSLETWEREWLTLPEATFVALADGEVVGCAGLHADADHPERAENALTAVRRDWRRRGVAFALKQTTLAWAAANGIREVYTWTQRGNADMRRLNEGLGYVTRTESVRVRADLPLE